MGGVKGDAIRSIWADLGNAYLRQMNGQESAKVPTGAMLRSVQDGAAMQQPAANGATGWYARDFYSERVAPVGAANVPRSWGSLACAYFGQRTKA